MEIATKIALMGAISYVCQSLSWLVTTVVFHSRRGELQLVELRRVYNYTRAVLHTSAMKFLAAACIGLPCAYWGASWVDVAVLSMSWAAVTTLSFKNRYLKNVPAMNRSR